MLKSKLPRLIFILWNLLNESIVEMKLSIIALDQIQGHHKVRLANHKSNIIVSSNVQTMVNHKKLCMKTCSEAIVTREPELLANKVMENHTGVLWRYFFFFPYGFNFKLF